MNDKQMRELINDFGIPAIQELENKKFSILFDDINVNGTDEKGYHCNVNDVKFCVYDIDKNTPIFTMDFFETSDRINMIYHDERHIKLELLYVHDKKLRNKGIATFYIRKLQQYAMDNDFKYIKVCPNPKANNFKGNEGLSMIELINYYAKLSTEDMPIKIIEL